LRKFANLTDALKAAAVGGSKEIPIEVGETFRSGFTPQLLIAALLRRQT